MTVVFVFGDIGSGKTEFCADLAELGARVISSDSLVAELYSNDIAMLNEIEELFGRNLRQPDGTADKKLIAELVFKDSLLREKLEAVIHPRVARLLQRELSQSSASVVIYEASALKQTSDTSLADVLVEVVADESLRRQRLADRGMNLCDIDARIRSQSDDLTRMDRRDVVVSNNEGPEELKREAQRLFSVWSAPHD